MRTILRVFSYVRGYPWMAAGTLSCAILTTLMVMVFPKITQLVIDEVRAGRPEHLLQYSLIALGAFFLRDFLTAAHSERHSITFFACSVEQTNREISRAG